MKRAVDALESVKDALEEIRATGGDTQLFARWYPNGDTAEVFDPPLLSRIAALGLTFGFNVYGVDPRWRRVAEGHEW